MVECLSSFRFRADIFKPFRARFADFCESGADGFAHRHECFVGVGSRFFCSAKHSSTHRSPQKVIHRFTVIVIEGTQ